MPCLEPPVLGRVRSSLPGLLQYLLQYIAVFHTAYGMQILHSRIQPQAGAELFRPVPSCPYGSRFWL